ncbi:MAG: chitobiase/beta-hexosaminidase C-terminal domain-containing protein [Victivallales bacterium]
MRKPLAAFIVLFWFMSCASSQEIWIKRSTYTFDPDGIWHAIDIPSFPVKFVCKSGSGANICQGTFPPAQENRGTLADIGFRGGDYIPVRIVNSPLVNYPHNYAIYVGWAPMTFEIYTSVPFEGPVISPPGGIIRPSTPISIASSSVETPLIYYTTDGADPTTSSIFYEYPFALSSSATVKAIAVYEGVTSKISAKTFQIGWSPPEIFPSSAGFQVGDEVEVTITNSPNNNGEGTIVFRYNYGPGQTSWTEYVNPIIVTETSTIEAKVAGSGGESDIVSATYEFVLEKVETPVISPTGGAFTELPAVEIGCVTQGATIYYTTNGTEPSKTSAVYAGPITLTGSSRVKAFAAKANMGDSDKVSRAYILDEPLPQGDGTGEDYNNYLSARNGLFDQYETLQDDGILDDIIDLDDDWTNGGDDTGTGDTDGGGTTGGTGDGGGTGDTDGTTGGTSTSTTNEGDSNYYTTSNTYNSYDNSSGDTDYMGLGAIGIIGMLPFLMKSESAPTVYDGGSSGGEDDVNYSKIIYFTR